MAIGAARMSMFWAIGTVAILLKNDELVIESLKGNVARRFPVGRA